MSATSPETPRHLLISCEHASSHVPADWADVIDPADPVLATHEGIDIGAADLARALHERLGGTLLMAKQTRLLIDINRSPHNYRRYSRYTRGLSKSRKAALQNQFHDPYWAEIQNIIARQPAVFHLSVHSFTPEWEGQARSTDIALLPLTTAQDVSALAHRWKPELKAAFPHLTVHINQPYTGNQDGLIRQLMIRRSDAHYLGIEIEVSQRIIKQQRDTLAHGIATTLAGLVCLTSDHPQANSPLPAPRR